MPRIPRLPRARLRRRAEPDTTVEPLPLDPEATAAHEPAAGPVGTEGGVTQPEAGPAGAVAGAPTTAVHAGPGVAPEAEAPVAGMAPDEIVAAHSFRMRGRMRRRLRFLRQARELAFRDLGGLVFDLHRFGRSRHDLVLAKLQRLATIEGELHAVEGALSERTELMLLREPGVSACPRCGEIHGSDANFCPNCGLPMRPGAALPMGPGIETATPAGPTVAAPHAAAAGPPAAESQAAPAGPPAAAPQPSAPAPSAGAPELAAGETQEGEAEDEPGAGQTGREHSQETGALAADGQPESPGDDGNAAASPEGADNLADSAAPPPSPSESTRSTG